MDKVLIVDDDRFMQNTLQKALYKFYDVRTADDGETGLRLAHNWQPNVILLDVEMPGKNGYEVCDALKHGTTTADIPVVFLSSHTSTREHMLGYEVGGDDFLVKPFKPEVLRKKLAIMAHYYRQKTSLKSSADNAQQTALEAMATSFELGKSVRFVEHTYSLGSYDALGKTLLDMVAEFKLAACAMFLTETGPRFYATQTVATPLEQEILQRLHGTDRFIDFGCRTQINHPQVALLIKNMPLEDRHRYGRLKDTLPFVLGATNAKLHVLDAEHALQQQNAGLVKSVRILEQLLVKVTEKLNTGESNIKQTLSDLTAELNLELHRLGLERDQEEFVLNKVEHAAAALHHSLVQAAPVAKTLGELIRLLNDMAAKQKRIIDESLAGEHGGAEHLTNDIELF